MTILAIDQGGTKTSVVIGDENGRILGMGSSAGACYYTDGLDKAWDYICQACKQALETAGITEQEIGQVNAALSGANWPDEIAMLERVLSERFNTANTHVVNDCVGALRGGTDHDDAIVLCAGTKFNSAVLKNREIITVYNNSVEADDAGGESLGRRAVEAALRPPLSMGPPTMLTELALDYFGFDSLHELTLAISRQQINKMLPGFCFSLDKAAQANDRVALEILREFGTSLSKYAVAAIQKYEMPACDVVVSGGVFKITAPILLDTVRANVHLVSSQANVINALYEPVIGAYLLGLEQNYGRPLPEHIREEVKAGADRYHLHRY